ncbi:Oxidoreductase family, C-terminal alpha/beta domain [Algoriphagus alkaliphilus]|uniref:Oxidoreductase family, C-terminal alpha/beta domain n=1 Tax=Algoriphagus alkaliphilus TaxID=279824 RepID=A0A1G5YFA3_9BACT|nr:oxidoreductase [Algoriphagus alkaliphilus]SDA80934.1 Oxidoreductase family, C-terminal alpha/beta domain [Algoriphagus alkaliphilus]
MNKPIRTALVGYGSVAEKMHAPLISVCPDLDLVGVVERNSTKCGEKFPNVRTFKSLEELLDADFADLICITTPNEFHYPMAKQCLLAGKHVVVDKPVTIYSHEAEELEKIAKERNLICSVFHNRRYDGDFRTLQKLVAENTLGDLVYLESHFDRFRPQVSENWREKAVPGNGITFDLGSHLIDQVVLLFGKPDSIFADIQKQRKNAIADDYFDISLFYPAFKARATAGVLVNVPTPKFLLLGEKGSFQKFFLDVQEQAFKDGKKPEGVNWGVDPEDRWGKLFFENETVALPTLPGDYRIFYQNVADAILKDTLLQVTLPQTISVLKIIEAAFTSAREGRKISSVEGGW